MQFSVTLAGEEYNFEIDKEFPGYIWTLFDNDNIYEESERYFPDAFSAQLAALDYMRMVGDKLSGDDEDFADFAKEQKFQFDNSRL